LEKVTLEEEKSRERR